MTSEVDHESIIEIDSSAFSGAVSRNHRHPLSRIRYQLLGMVLFAVALPALLRYLQLPNFLNEAGTLISMGMVIPGVILTYFLWRRLHAYPDTNPVNVAAWAVGVIFLVLIFYIVFSRIEYNRTLVFTAPILSFAWLLVISYVMRRDRPLRVGVLPAANLASLPKSSSIQWIELTEPPSPHMFDGYVANLRHDYCKSWEHFVVQSTLEGVPVYHTKQIIEQITGRVTVDHLSENNFGSVLPNLNYLVAKRVLDLCAVAVAVVPLAVVAIIVATLIRLREGGPIIFRQKRIGRRGKLFTVYKFRTMRVPTQSISNDVESAKTKRNDPRITPLGKILRKYRLDEIPQLLNILRGEMSWIGPRPEAAVLGRSYEEKFPYYRYRYAVRPGITGWAQVCQGHVTNDDDVRVKLEYDFYYVKNVSFWLDTTITIKTIQTILAGRLFRR